MPALYSLRKTARSAAKTLTMPITLPNMTASAQHTRRGSEAHGSTWQPAWRALGAAGRRQKSDQRLGAHHGRLHALPTQNPPFTDTGGGRTVHHHEEECALAVLDGRWIQIGDVQINQTNDETQNDGLADLALRPREEVDVGDEGPKPRKEQQP